MDKRTNTSELPFLTICHLGELSNLLLLNNFVLILFHSTEFYNPRHAVMSTESRGGPHMFAANFNLRKWDLILPNCYQIDEKHITL